MKFYLVIFFQCAFMAAFSQQKNYDASGDTTYWLAQKQKDVKRIGLADMTKSTDSLHIRFWMENEAIEIWTNDYITFHGIISNHTQEVSKVKNGKYYSEKQVIPDDSAKKVYDLFINKNILSIPTDNKIKGWKEGKDGEQFLLEYSTKNFYSFKTYWSPSFFPAIKEAVAIDNLRRELRTTLNLQKRWSYFVNSLPKGCYLVGQMTMLCVGSK